MGMKATKEVLDAIDKAHRDGMILKDEVAKPIRFSPERTCGKLAQRESEKEDASKPEKWTKLVAESEDDFQRSVLLYAKSRGWRTAHFRKAKTKKGWRTAVGGDGKGFTDLVLVRDRVVFVELKSKKGKLSPDQKRWRDALLAADAEWYCWRPSDREEMERVLL